MNKVTVSLSNCTKNPRVHVGINSFVSQPTFQFTTTNTTTGTGGDAQLLNATLEIRIYP